MIQPASRETRDYYVDCGLSTVLPFVISAREKGQDSLPSALYTKPTYFMRYLRIQHSYARVLLPDTEFHHNIDVT